MRLWQLLTPAWQRALVNQQIEIEKIDDLLKQQSQFNPARENIFRALGNSPSDFRVIIVGQDPYPDPKLATGYAFAIPVDQKIPPTLRNISREFKSDIGKDIPTDLSAWASKGVLLLNRVLTCQTGKSLSHEKIGWQCITDAVISAVVSQNSKTVGILWGNYAKQVAPLFSAKQLISSVHPSGLSAHRGFFGSKPFSKTNELLTKSNQKPIEWA